MRRPTTTALALLLASGVLVSASPAAAQAVRDNVGFGTNTLPANDDGFTGLVDIGFTTNFFGVSNTQLYVNNNGNVTFDDPLGTFTPFNLSTTSREIIAPFFGDVDTRSGLPEVTYGVSTIDGRNAFGVNWLNVGYFSVGADKRNTFQLVLVDRSDLAVGDFDFEFNYNQIQWETGGASGGVGGLGGSSARAGYSNGTGSASFELAGSAVNGAFLDGGPNALSANSLNSDVTGRYLFSVRNGVVLPPTTVVPEPSTYILLGSGLLGLMLLRRSVGA